MQVPGSAAKKELEQARAAAYQLSVRAAGLAGLGPPPSDRAPVADLLAATTEAVAVLAERVGNTRRRADDEREQLGADRAGWKRSRGQIAEALAELRDRLRRAGPADGPPVWALQHIDGILRLAGAAEFRDEGPLDPTRHRVVRREPAGAGHPAGTIAGTTRDGLLLDGEVLRQQEVTAYVDLDRIDLDRDHDA